MRLTAVWLTLGLAFLVKADELKNVTEHVFGDKDLNMMPVAFGDFNSDKMTDVIVWSLAKSELSILLAKEQTLANVLLTSQTYFSLPDSLERKKKNELVCHINKKTVLSVSPGDFDGDGGMDILVFAKDDDDEEIEDKASFF